MSKYLSVMLFSVTMLLSGCQLRTENDANSPALPTTPALGSADWQQWVDTNIQSGDGQGHGPDIGSEEWCGTIDHRIFRGSTGLTPCSDEWNQKVTEVILKKSAAKM